MYINEAISFLGLSNKFIPMAQSDLERRAGRPMDLAKLFRAKEAQIIAIKTHLTKEFEMEAKALVLNEVRQIFDTVCHRADSSLEGSPQQTIGKPFNNTTSGPGFKPAALLYSDKAVVGTELAKEHFQFKSLKRWSNEFVSFMDQSFIKVLQSVMKTASSFMRITPLSQKPIDHHIAMNYSTRIDYDDRLDIFYQQGSIDVKLDYLYTWFDGAANAILKHTSKFEGYLEKNLFKSDVLHVNDEARLSPCLVALINGLESIQPDIVLLTGGLVNEYRCYFSRHKKILISKAFLLISQIYIREKFGMALGNFWDKIESMATNQEKACFEYTQFKEVIDQILSEKFINVFDIVNDKFYQSNTGMQIPIKNPIELLIKAIKTENLAHPIIKVMLKSYGLKYDKKQVGYSLGYLQHLFEPLHKLLTELNKTYQKNFGFNLHSSNIKIKGKLPGLCDPTNRLHYIFK